MYLLLAVQSAVNVIFIAIMLSVPLSQSCHRRDSIAVREMCNGYNGVSLGIIIIIIVIIIIIIIVILFLNTAGGIEYSLLLL